jgi:DNA-binding NtrC family response regulator
VPAKVVFLDDSEDLRHLLTILLKTRLGLDCLTLSRFQQMDDHLVEILCCETAILDINLGAGEPSGLEAYKWLKERGFKGQIIFLTGHANSDPEVLKVASLDVVLLEKPLDPSRLFESMGRAGGAS